MDRSRVNYWQITYWLGIGWLAIVYFIRSKGYSVDDSFITYRYAYHLKEGYGLVFNVGERYYGTTAAGYAVVLAAASSALDVLFRVTNSGAPPSIQEVSVAFSALSLCTIAACLPVILQAGSHALRWVVCAVFAVYLFAGQPFNQVAGHETYAYLAVALLATLLAERGRVLLAGCVLGVAASFRPDAILFVPILVLVDTARNQASLTGYLASKNFRYFCIGLAAVIVPWFIYLGLHFGQITPGTMDAKRAQVQLGSWPFYNIGNVVRYLFATGFSVMLVIGAGLYAGAWMAAKRFDRRTFLQDRGLFIAIVWLLFGAGSTCAYLLFKVTFWPWYGVPVLFSLGAGSLAGWRLIVDRPVSATDRGIFGDKLANVVRFSPVILLVLVALGATGSLRAWYGSTNRNAHIHAYEEVADYLKRMEPAGTSVQMCEPGAFGFGLGPRYQIIDELGLITPGVAKAYLRGDSDYANRTYQAKYLVCSCALAYLECAKPDLNEKFELVGEGNTRFWKPQIGHGALLYRRRGE